MSGLTKSDESYARWIAELKDRYRTSQIKAASSVNSNILAFYWSLGRDIVARDAENTYGSDFYSTLSTDLRRAIPNANGFSQSNLRYMKRFYMLFASPLENLPQLEEDSPEAPGGTGLAREEGPASKGAACVDPILSSVPWGHIRQIIDKCKGDRDMALFYAHKTVENGWSRAVLANQIGSRLYERQGKALTNFSARLPAPRSDLAQEITKDPYQFDFLTIREGYDEAELKKALMDNIQQFLLELGTGFAYIGREFEVRVGNRDKFFDMLFYHTRLHCYVVLEVKVGEFDSSDMGQLGTYVVAANHKLRTDVDGPTIGLLVCKGLDKVEAQYALEASSQPIGISGYELSKLLPEDFKGSLPTIEEIERELEEQE